MTTETRVWGVVGIPGAGKSTLCRKLVQEGEDGDFFHWERDNSEIMKHTKEGGEKWIMMQTGLMEARLGTISAEMADAIRPNVEKVLRKILPHLERYQSSPQYKTILDGIRGAMPIKSSFDFIMVIAKNWHLILAMEALQVFLRDTAGAVRGGVRAILCDNPNLYQRGVRGELQKVLKMEGLGSGLLVMQTDNGILAQSIEQRMESGPGQEVYGMAVMGAARDHDPVLAQEGWERLVVARRHTDIAKVSRRMLAKIDDGFLPSSVPLLRDH